MEVTTRTLTHADLENIADHVGVNLYNYRAREMRSGETRHAFILRPRKPGHHRQRRRVRGRWLWAVCWHGHYEFMHRLFDADPAARLKSALADYRGRDAFHKEAWLTGARNIGTDMDRSQYESECECEDARTIEAMAREGAGVPELV